MPSSTTQFHGRRGQNVEDTSGLTNAHSDLEKQLLHSPAFRPRQLKPRAYDHLSEEPPTVDACFSHLRLLEAFVILRDEVRGLAWSCHADQDAGWEAFVRLAASRFNRWFATAGDTVMQTSLPPLDVLMVWHSFMLRPHSYADFCKTARPDGAGVHGIPWSLVHEAISVDSGKFVLSKSQTKHAALSNLPADLLEPLKREDKTGIDIMDLMAAEYRRNEARNSGLPTGFAPPLDLAAAVHRQMGFALKMTRFGWAHSPHSDSILQRAVARYRKFLSLFAVTGHAIVPTVDIDLVWHTHQLSPACYALFSHAVTMGRFINHNDSIEQGAIQTAFESTKRLYYDLFGEDYSICNSWFCEATRFDRNGVLADTDLTALQSIVTRLNRRTRQLERSVVLDLAVCRCYETDTSSSRWGHEQELASCGDCGSHCSGS
ncbi:uncharacterized protein B0H64DRAFT_409216 [Chaetomium fimeti]|uniref:Uncharacterized protein n=1 Tax=Chaetomium fimeti TaxID=1854472 RepID=A0AAE0LND1_9PEZI|nr:hypothetical protein B0H64DRAFT_409216 [Chaetomium fimeti]